MKRGLVVLDPAETPTHEWAERVRTLQKEMAAQGIDVALVYGDVSRSDDIAYLTNLCIYWNEGVLAVPAHGPVTFLTKLSLRVQNWMRQSSTVTEFRGGKNFAELASAWLQDREPGTIGLVDAMLWPADVVEEINSTVDGWKVERLGGLVREQRLVPSDSEAALLRTAGRILDEATAAAQGDSPRHRLETVERTLRGAGFLDLLPTVMSTSDGMASLGVTAQYRTGWVHSSRILSGTDAGWPRALDDALGAAISAARAGAPRGDLDGAARPALATLPGNARAEVRWIEQADLSTGGDLHDSDPAAPLVDGAAGAISIEVAFRDGGHAAVAETVRITDGEPERLTGARR